MHTEKIERMLEFIETSTAPRMLIKNGFGGSVYLIDIVIYMYYIIWYCKLWPLNCFKTKTLYISAKLRQTSMKAISGTFARHLIAELVAERYCTCLSTFSVGENFKIDFQCSEMPRTFYQNSF